MIRFNNDYNHGAHPAVLQALLNTNDQSFGGYGLDECCTAAANEIRKYLNCPDAAIHFLVGGTQANVTVIDAALRPYQAVICADTGHIHAHETGAVEHCGHKILALPGTDGKITAAQIAKVAESYRVSPVQEHIPQPKMVYLSFPTELGTIYSKAELEAIRAVCDRYDLYLFLDGARLGYGLAASDLEMPDLARLCDVFYCGGTKCGALFGEAVVITRSELKDHFRSSIKQNGGMLAKGWLLGLQFETLFRDGLYFEITRRANEYAMQIKQAFAAKGVPFSVDSPTNQQFVILNRAQIAALEEKYTFEQEEIIDEEHMCVRFCTNWSNTQEEIDALVQDIAQL